MPAVTLKDQQESRAGAQPAVALSRPGARPDPARRLRPGHDPDARPRGACAQIVAALLQQDMHERRAAGGQPPAAGAPAGREPTTQSLTHGSISIDTVLPEPPSGERDAWPACAAQGPGRRGPRAAVGRPPHAYRDSYRQQWSNRFRTLGSGIDVVHCYQGFSSRLDQAISSWGDSVTKAQSQLAQVHAHWLACEQKVASIGKLIERRQAERRIRAARQTPAYRRGRASGSRTGHAAQMLAEHRPRLTEARP